jgi:hypothetical protein
MRKLAVELVSIADDVMASGRTERTKKELGEGLANWVHAFKLLQGYGNTQAQGILRQDIEKMIKDKDLDSNTVWNVK